MKDVNGKTEKPSNEEQHRFLKPDSGIIKSDIVISLEICLVVAAAYVIVIFSGHFFGAEMVLNIEAFLLMAGFSFMIYQMVRESQENEKNGLKREIVWKSPFGIVSKRILIAAVAGVLIGFLLHVKDKGLLMIIEVFISIIGISFPLVFFYIVVRIFKNSNFKYNMMIFSVIAASFAVLLVNMMHPRKIIRAKMHEDLVSCESNLKKIANSIKIYGNDNNGQFPRSLKVLKPEYLKNIPVCPATGKDTYSDYYTLSHDDSVYTLCCRGRNHRNLRVDGDYPQYDSKNGLLEGKPAQ